MANLTFADIQNEVYAHTGLDSSDATNVTNVNRWINYVQQDICDRWPWTFMEGRENIATIPDIIGTAATVTNASTSASLTLAASSGLASSNNNTLYYVQFSTANDWYRIESYSGAYPSITIVMDNRYQLASASNISFIVRRFYYSLSSSADRIVDIRNWNTPLKIVQVDARTLDDIRPNPQSTNSSYGYLAWGYDASGNIQVSPYPFPSDARLLEIRTLKRPVDMSSAGDFPSIPNKYAHIIAWGAISVGYAFLRKFTEAEAWSARTESRIAEMKREFRMSEDYQPILRSIDSVQRAKWISLPEQYPVVTG